MNRRKMLLASFTTALVVGLTGTGVAYGGSVARADETQAKNFSCDFTTAGSLSAIDGLAVGFDPAANNETYTQEEWVTYSKTLGDLFTLDGGLKVNTSAYSGDAVDGNRIYVRADGAEYRYFTAELVYTYNSEDRNGWAGFMFGYTNYERQARWGDSPYGVEMFVQKEGKGTYASAKLNDSGFTETNAYEGYTILGEHKLVLTVSETGATMTVDGKKSSEITKDFMTSKQYEIPTASVGFFLTNGDFTVKSFSVTDNGGQSGDVYDPEKDPDNPIHYTYRNVYDFTGVTDVSSVKDFSAGIDPAQNDDRYTSDGWVTYGKALNEIFTADGGLKIDPSVYSGNDVSENNIYTRLNTKNLQYFKAELVYTYNSADRNGWAGFMFGYTNFERKARWGDSPYGVELFVQKSGKGTYSSAKLNDASYTEGEIPAKWEPVGEHKLTVVAIGSGVTLYADGYKVVEITREKMEEKGYAMTAASMGFYFTNGDFTAKKFSYSALGANGEEYVAVTGISGKDSYETSQFEGVAVEAKVLPEDASLKTLNYELPAGAVAVGDKLYFANAGTYTIRVSSADVPEIYKDITVTVTGDDKYIAYRTDEASAKKNFEHYVVTSGGAKDGQPQNVENYWTFNEDGSMTLTENIKSAVDAGFSMLYLKDVVSGAAMAQNCFELSYMVKTNNAPNGWHGVGFALGDRTTIPNQNGISAFIQEEARKATIWGSGKSGVSGPYEVDSLYARNTWNVVRVKVFGAGNEYKVQFFINDMETPAIERETSAIAAEDIALFTTTVITLKDVYYAQLNAEGERIDLVYPESVTVTNEKKTAEIGETWQIETEVLPANATQKGVTYESSDALIATVTAEGLVSFRNAGEVTITVACKGDPSVKTEQKVTVKAKEVLPTKITFDATPGADKTVVGGKYTLFVTVSPENATNYKVHFSSSDETIATVDENGRISFLAAGTVTITVTADADETVKNSITLTVTGGAKQDSAAASDGKTTSGGCGGSFGGIGALAGLALLSVAAMKRKMK